MLRIIHKPTLLADLNATEAWCWRGTLSIIDVIWRTWVPAPGTPFTESLPNRT